MDLKRNLNSDRGDSRITNIILIVVSVVFVLLIWKIGWPFFQNMRLATFAEKQVNYDREDYILDAAMMRSIAEKTYNRAKSLHLPVSDRDIKIDAEGDRAILEIKYNYPVDLFLFKFDMNFKINRRSEGLGFKD